MPRMLSKKVTDDIKAGVRKGQPKKQAVAIALAKAQNDILVGTDQITNVFSDMGISTAEAAKSLNILADVLGSSSRNVTITRRKGKNRDTARIEGKDIHGGHVSISPLGVKTFEIQVNFKDQSFLDSFQVGDRVTVSGKIVKKTLHLQIVDRKIQGEDVALLYLEDRFRSYLVKHPETEEENLDILHELSQ